MNISLPIVSLGFIALAWYMISNNIQGYGWVIALAAACGLSFKLNTKRNESEATQGTT